MKRQIKVGGKTFEFQFPAGLELHEELNAVEDSVMAKALFEWCKLAAPVESPKDVWVELEQLPGYKFKNLKVEQSEILEGDDANEITFTFKYDEFKEIL
jgi:hypothetical protein